MALDSDGDASAKRLRAGEEGNQGDVSDGDAITKRLRVDEEGNQGADTVALESDSDDTTERLRADGKAIHGDATVGLALVSDCDAGARIPREDDGGSQDDDDAAAGAMKRATGDRIVVHRSSNSRLSGDTHAHEVFDEIAKRNRARKQRKTQVCSRERTPFIFFVFTQ